MAWSLTGELEVVAEMGGSKVCVGIPSGVNIPREEEILAAPKALLLRNLSAIVRHVRYLVSCKVN